MKEFVPDSEIPIIKEGTQNTVPFGYQVSLVFVCKRELKIFWNRNRQNICSRAYLHLSGLSVSSIKQVGSGTDRTETNYGL